MVHDFFDLQTREAVLALLADVPGLSPPVMEEVELADALGRILALDVESPENLPPFSRSCMDGYAVRAQDTFGATESAPSQLLRVGELAVDATSTVPLKPGESVGILTGGVLPPGADAVVMVEYTEEAGADTVLVHRAVAPGEHVMQAGEDVAEGHLAWPAGTSIDVAQAGLLAALGIDRVAVVRRPRVAIISTGDELVGVNETPKPGQVRDVNATSLAMLVRRAGGEPLVLPRVGDALGALRSALRTACRDADVVVLSGGSSMGVRDLTVEAIQGLDRGRVLVHGIAVSPGKPTILADVGGIPVLGLPGQIASAQVVMHLFGAPLIRHLLGVSQALATTPPPTTVRGARLSRSVRSKPGREDFIRVRLEDGPDADPLPLAVPVTGPAGLLRTVARSHGLVRIGRDQEGLAKGTLVRVQPL